MSAKKRDSSGRSSSSDGDERRDGPRFIVGIDLGTTNCAVAYVDLLEEEPGVRSFAIPQLVKPGAVEAHLTMPSFVYLAGEHDFPEESRKLPWDDPGPGIAGLLAREQGAKVPARLVSSAKSWLCHAGVDRRARILPWGLDDPSSAALPKLSPLEASARYLDHMRRAWDHEVAKGERALELARQDVLLTVPASFDAVARELTVEAATIAGLARVTLLEEPQAAFYSWLERQGESWRRKLALGDLVLVCDVGGGTTDFSLISVSQEQGNLVLERTAVGEHLLLGGDNMDVALAHVLAERLRSKGTNLDPWQSRGLWYACRQAKEEILSSEKEISPVVVLGRGSKLIGGTIKTELTRADVSATIVEGFFPRVAADARPVLRQRTGLQEIGLPFEPDAAATKHLARFLGRHGPEGGLAKPTALLFNGGVFRGAALRERTREVLDSWLVSSGAKPVSVLEGEDLDLAVARGAAYYGLVRRGRGVRIRGGTARAYYVGIASAMPAVPGVPPPLKALCVAGMGMEEGTEVAVPGREFALLVGEPAEFRFLGSTVRKDDRPGTLVDRWEEGEITELAPLETALEDSGKAGATVPVTLHAHVTEVGTLEVSCVARDGRRWKLSWNVRDHES
ncbi:Hsp70 family protein [bacterium]|nr:Hsp70 family protein [bacterium]